MPGQEDPGTATSVVQLKPPSDAPKFQSVMKGVQTVKRDKDAGRPLHPTRIHGKLVQDF